MKKFKLPADEKALLNQVGTILFGKNYPQFRIYNFDPNLNCVRGDGIDDIPF